MRDGHGWKDITEPSKWRVVAVVSVAAICQPAITRDPRTDLERYVNGAHARLMEEKMRVILRMAAKNGHRQLVLGAFGCGAFGNPSGEVARMWKSVLEEAEFSGGWWQDIVFAVLDNDGRGNYQIFKDKLHGTTV